MMFLAPLPTFIRVYRKKSTEGFHSIPYVVALFSAMLWIYYAILKSTDYLLLSINSSGCLVEIIYIIVYIIYAPKKAKMLTLKLLIVMNIGGFSAILVLTHFFAKGSSRLSIVGWLCVALSAVVFAAPLSIMVRMRLVIRTKSVEFMPFWLSFFLTLSAIMWLLYGVLLKDIYIALPNVIGVLLGTVQMALYAIYKDGKRASSKNSTQNLSETADGTAIIMLNSIQTTNSDDNGVLGNEENQKEPKKPHGEFVESLNQVQPISES
ncbi:hypothetical protein JCGZ_26402 [Jatropha curcas]|uniref:Bidirectional sugar transporter SWEET n=1 Tax=Jatropha curcas TaxID=180498 RepID=A0A067JF78_JATCU|nr:hypothetical protein JCGZ_26402 [Jatropha curcas]